MTSCHPATSSPTPTTPPPPVPRLPTLPTTTIWTDIKGRGGHQVRCNIIHYIIFLTKKSIQTIVGRVWTFPTSFSMRFEQFQHEQGGFNPTPLPFDLIQCEQGGFNTTPLFSDAIPCKQVGSIPTPLVLTREQSGFNPTPILFHVFRRKWGDFNTTPFSMRMWQGVVPPCHICVFFLSMYHPPLRANILYYN